MLCSAFIFKMESGISPARRLVQRHPHRNMYDVTPSAVAISRSYLIVNNEVVGTYFSAQDPTQ